MLKCLRIPANQFELASVMLLMTGGAFEFFREMVIALPIVHARADFRMAAKTVISEGFLSKIMTFRAVAYPFEIFVRVGQLPRRSQLRLGDRGQQTQNKRCKDGGNARHHAF